MQPLTVQVTLSFFPIVYLVSEELLHWCMTWQETEKCTLHPVGSAITKKQQRKLQFSHQSYHM